MRLKQVPKHETPSTWPSDPAINNQEHLVFGKIVKEDGFGPAVDVRLHDRRLLVLTLDINSVAEEGCLLISVWGSPDATDWGSRPLNSFPKKYYCGVYSILLNLAAFPDVHYLRLEWRVAPWFKGKPTPTFGFSVFFEESGSRICTAV